MALSASLIFLVMMRAYLSSSGQPSLVGQVPAFDWGHVPHPTPLHKHGCLWGRKY